MKRLGIAAVLVGAVSAAGADDKVKKPAPPPPPAVKLTVEWKRGLDKASLEHAILTKIEATYAAGIKRCYQTKLARAVEGRVAIALKVTATGTTTAIKVTSFDTALESCVAGQVAAWTFQTPKPSEAASFQVGLRLTPNQGVALTEEDALKYAEILVGSDPTPGEGDMSKRRPGAELGKQIDSVTQKDRDKSVAIGGGTRGDGGVATGKGPTVTQDPKSVDKGPHGRISISSKKALDSTTLTPDVVLSKIMWAYMTGLKRCYKQVLTTNPIAKGVLTLKLTVNETGRATNPRVTSFDKALDSCVAGMIGGWRFPVPKAADAEATSASFEIGMQLVPD